MAIRQPPGYMAGTFTAAHLRAYTTLGFVQDPAGAVPRAMSGVIPRGGNLDWPISQTGATVTVGVGAAIVAGTENSQQHAYLAVAESAQSIAVPTTTAAQTRLDRIGIRVRDSAFSGSAVDGDIVLVQGVPASSNPQLPAEPANFLTLATVSTTGSNTPVVTPAWRYTSAAGGIRPARSGTVDDGVAPQYPGQYRDLGGRLQRGSASGGTWQTIASIQEWQEFTPVLYSAGAGAIPLGTGGTAIGRYMVQGKSCHLRYVFRAARQSQGFNGGSLDVTTRLPPGITSAASEETQILAKLNAVLANADTLQGIYLGKCFIPPNSTMMNLYFPVDFTRSDLRTYQINGGGGAGTGTPQVPGDYPRPGVLVIQGTIEIQ